jgi:CheY-like chemotaxis protein
MQFTKPPSIKGRVSGSIMSSIVIVEEDRLIRSLLVEWLSAEGYSVRISAPEDRQSLEGADLLIVDVVMPRHEGRTRLRGIKAAHPQTPLIAISGQFRPGLDGSTTAAGALGVRRVVAKPFSRCDLLAAVHCVIGPAI